VSELSHPGVRFIHKPWAATDPDLCAAGVTLGTTCPQPIVVLASVRARALDTYWTEQDVGLLRLDRGLPGAKS
jgi:hypothetical protein